MRRAGGARAWTSTLTWRGKSASGGAHGGILQYEVQYILDSVTDALLLNPERKFIEVEM